jgi:hypothetical protein
MSKLGEMILEHNPYAYGFTSMHEKLVQEELKHAKNSKNTDKQFLQPRMYLVHQNNEDPRRFNEPVSSADMAAVFVGEQELPPSGVTLRVYPTSAHGGYQTLKDCNPHRDPMVFPLLFPYGELGNKIIKIISAVNLN